jgi:hypothetical protein
MTYHNVEFARVDKATMDRLYKRACGLAGRLDRMAFEMDIAAAGANGNPPFDFHRLASADDVTFAHDVFGILRHMDRSTGRLAGHFTPRTARVPA